MEMKTAVFLIIYAFLILVGGIVGYFKANSLLSLWVSIGFFIPYLIFAISVYKHKKFGAFACLGLTLVLLAFFLYRYMLTHAFFPAGLMLILSFVTLLICLIVIFRLRRY